MFRQFFARHRAGLSISLTTAFVLGTLVMPNLSPHVSAQQVEGSVIPDIDPGSAYRQTNLVSDSPGLAPILDPLLVNPWGISFNGTSPFWVANAGSDTSTLYRETAGNPLIINPTRESINIQGGLPTGTVGNTTDDFRISVQCVNPPCATFPAQFIFASISGNITAWNPNVNANTALIVAHPPNNPGPRVYTGLANGSNITGNKLYAADIANNHIDVFDANFALTTVPGGFVDASIPPGYHVHNIQNLGGPAPLYVTYAKIGPNGRVENGVGNGYVRRFDTNGFRDNSFGIDGDDGVPNPLDRVPLDGPWGLAIAPANFGIFSNALLVGNFAFDGAATINAFNPTSGAFLGTIEDESGEPISNDGLWALQFGNGGAGGDPNTLYFTAGIGRETHGLFGSLKPTTATATSLIQFSTDDYAIGEGGGHIDITVTRSGDVSGSATVNYATFDDVAPAPAPSPAPAPQPHGSQKSDYEIALGTLRFDPGETSETFRILLVDDRFVEGNEEIDLVLSNPTGAGVGLGSPSTSVLTVLDNDAVAPTSNPIDEAQFFVRQHYLDFLNREPDAGGLAFWTNTITSCGANQSCIDAARVQVSAAFFLSIEFQETGFLALMANQAAFGERPLYGQFMRDVQALQKDFAFGAPGSAAILEANKQQYFNDFVARPEFVTKYPASMTNEQYVDALLTSAGLTPSQVRLFVVQMTNGQESPPAVPTSSNGGGPRPVSFGTARFQFNQAQTSLTITGTVNNIDFTGAQTPAEANDNLTAAHIHANSTVPPPATRGVVFGFIGTPFNDNNPNDAVVTPFASGVGGDFRAKWDAPEGNGTTLAAQLSNLREGRAYINFHTTQFGGGEIRGNIPAADAFRNALVNGLNNATETRATVLRKVAEAEELKLREFNASFVLMEYFGYLRRDPDPEGFQFWLDKLNTFNGDFIQAQMVQAFITSIEYRQRFGPG